MFLCSSVCTSAATISELGGYQKHGFAVAAEVEQAAEVERADQTPGDLERLSRLRQTLQGLPSVPVIPREEQKLLQVGVIGVPNAGKSTLLNSLIGSKVSAVSPKTNTTFLPTLGAFTHGNTQIILQDTPGVVDSRHYRNPDHLRRVKSAWTTARNCDLLLLLIDAFRQTTKKDARVIRLVEELAEGKHFEGEQPSTLLLLNKLDRIRGAEHHEKVDRLAEQLSGINRFEGVFQISAARGDGIPELKHLLISRANHRPWLLEAQQRTNTSEPDLAIEVTREKIYRRLRQELPYRLKVEQTAVQPKPDGSLLLKQDILVPNEIVRRMVVGKSGSVVGEIGWTARLELEQMFQRKVHLFISVRVSGK